MVKVFQVVLTPPSQAFYSNCSAIPGYVELVTDVAKSCYECITVTLSGHATVILPKAETMCGTQTLSVSYSFEDYSGHTIILWDKNNAPSQQMAPGTYQFPFALHFRKGWSSLPSSFKSFYGSIKYKVEAVLVRSGAFKFDKTVCVEVPCVTVVDLNVIPGVLIPKTQFVRKTSFLYTGSILLSAHIPRNCFCVDGTDAIPFEVDVTNGSAARIRFLRAKLKQRVTHSADNLTLVQSKTIVSKKSEPIRAGINYSWRPTSLLIPAILPSITTCGIIKLEYYLKIEAAVFGISNPSVEFSLRLGNVPLNGLPHS